MKQTAVEKLEISLLGVISFDSEELRAKYKEAIKQAKEMEKQQRGYSEEDIAKAFDEGVAYETQGKLIRGKEWIKTHKKEQFEQFKNK